MDDRLGSSVTSRITVHDRIHLTIRDSTFDICPLDLAGSERYRTIALNHIGILEPPHQGDFKEKPEIPHFRYKFS